VTRHVSSLLTSTGCLTTQLRQHPVMSTALQLVDYVTAHEVAAGSSPLSVAFAVIKLALEAHITNSKRLQWMTINAQATLNVPRLANVAQATCDLKSSLLSLSPLLPHLPANDVLAIVRNCGDAHAAGALLSKLGPAAAPCVTDGPVSDAPQLLQIEAPATSSASRAPAACYQAARGAAAEAAWNRPGASAHASPAVPDSRMQGGPCREQQPVATSHPVLMEPTVARHEQATCCQLPCPSLAPVAKVGMPSADTSVARVEAPRAAVPLSSGEQLRCSHTRGQETHSHKHKCQKRLLCDTSAEVELSWRAFGLHCKAPRQRRKRVASGLMLHPHHLTAAIVLL
jgi:hypothetical protein